MSPYKTILIAGPTASGKSGAALELAVRHGGVIVNTDSMQVYRDLRLITARPSQADEAIASHRFYGHIDADTLWSTGAWLRSIQVYLPQWREEFETVIFVGGTGLYFSALTSGLSDIPETPHELRFVLRNELAELGAGQLYAQLKAEDPEMAEFIEPQDGQRTLRALEVLRHTGRSLREWQTSKSPPLIDLDAPSTKAVVLDPERELLGEKIEQRFSEMVCAGGLEEVTALLKRDLDPKLPLMKAIGVAELGSYLSGGISLEAAIQLAAIASRQYAKRQRTWFRGQMGEKWQRFADSSSIATVL